MELNHCGLWMFALSDAEKVGYRRVTRRYFYGFFGIIELLCKYYLRLFLCQNIFLECWCLDVEHLTLNYYTLILFKIENSPLKSQTDGQPIMFFRINYFKWIWMILMKFAYIFGRIVFSCVLRIFKTLLYVRYPKCMGVSYSA